MLHSFAWALKVVALVVVAMAIPVGVSSDDIRTEVAMLGLGGGLFLLARWLDPVDTGD